MKGLHTFFVCFRPAKRGPARHDPKTARPGPHWATVCKTVRPMLSDRCLSVCLSVLSVCNVSVLWPIGWMDRDETWHAGRPRPWPHCVR